MTHGSMSTTSKPADPQQSPALPRADFERRLQTLLAQGRRPRQTAPTAGEPGDLAVSLGRVIDPGPASVPHLDHTCLESIRFGTDEPALQMDAVSVPCHGPELTHLDTPAHIDYSFLDGSTACLEPNDEDLAPVVGRGVLVDVPALHGIDWLKPGYGVTTADLDHFAQTTGEQITAGDIVLVRTGRWRRRKETGDSYDGGIRPGLSGEAALMLLTAGVGGIGGDGGNDVRPSGVEGVSFPVHVLTLLGCGLPLFDNLDLEELSERCADSGRWTFGFACTPLRFAGVTGMPVTPVALLHQYSSPPTRNQSGSLPEKYRA